MSNIPVAGIDISKSFSDMCILAPNNSVFQRVKIYHDITSMNRSLDSLREAEKSFGTKPVLVMESTSHYHLLLHQFMINAGYTVAVINPLQSGSVKNINIRKVKNDKVDAYKLAILYRLGDLKPSIMPEQTIASLRALTRQHSDVRQDITRYVNRLISIIDQAFPGYVDIFSDIDSKSSLAILENYPTPQDIINASKPEIVSLLSKTSRAGSAWAVKKTDSLVAAAIAASLICIRREADKTLIRTCVLTIRMLSENVRAIDLETKIIINNTPDISHNIELLQSIPGIGEFSAAVILAEMGDPAAFTKPKQLTAFFGLDPSVRQSGKFKGTKNMLSKRGSRYVRQILNMAAHNCIHNTHHGKPNNPVLAEYYKKKRLSKPHKVVICAVMHKIVNIVFAVLRDQKPFELRDPKEHNRLLKNHNAKQTA